MKCPNCSLINPDTAQRCECGFDLNSQQVTPALAAANESEQPSNRTLIQVKNRNGEIQSYDDWDQFRADLVQGLVGKKTRVRFITEQELQNAVQAKQIKWRTIKDLTAQNQFMGEMYRPVWLNCKKFILYGIIGCVTFKAVETSIQFFQVNQMIGILCLVTIGSLFFKKWVVPIFTISVCLKAGIAATVLGAAFGAGVVGTLFGIPIGMIFGTLVGYVKYRKHGLAADAEPEGWQPYVFGLVAPAIGLALLTYGYFYWFTPMLEKLLS